MLRATLLLDLREHLRCLGQLTLQESISLEQFVPLTARKLELCLDLVEAGDFGLSLLDLLSALLAELVVMGA